MLQNLSNKAGKPHLSNTTKRKSSN